MKLITKEELNSLGFIEVKQCGPFTFKKRWNNTKVFKLNRTISILNNSNTIAYYLECGFYKDCYTVYKIAYGNDSLLDLNDSRNPIKEITKLKQMLKLLNISVDIFTYEKKVKEKLVDGKFQNMYRYNDDDIIWKQ